MRTHAHACARMCTHAHAPNAYAPACPYAEMYYLEWYSLYLSPVGWAGHGPASVSVRIAATTADGASVTLPDEIASLAVYERGVEGCKEDYSVGCFTGGTAGTGEMTNQNVWKHIDALGSCSASNFEEDAAQNDRCMHMDDLFRPSYLLDPIPSELLRFSGPLKRPPPLHPGGRGALREIWGWGSGEGACLASTEPKKVLYLDQAWHLPAAHAPGAPEPSLLADLPSNESEIVSEIWTPSSPFRGMNCYMETITAYFRPKARILAVSLSLALLPPPRHHAGSLARQADARHA